MLCVGENIANSQSDLPNEVRTKQADRGTVYKRHNDLFLSVYI